MYKSFKTDGTPVMNEVLFNLPLKRKYLSRIKEQRDGMLKQFIRLDDFQQEIINSSAMRDVFLSCHKPLALAPLRMRIMLILHAEEGRNSSIRLTEQCKLASSWPVWTLFQCSWMYGLTPIRSKKAQTYYLMFIYFQLGLHVANDRPTI